MSKFNVLSAVNQTADKKVFNRYQLSVGLKDVIALIPQANAAEFERMAEERQPQTMDGVKLLIRQYSGEIESL